MKKDIHPTYFQKAVVTCSCGAKHTIGSTREKMTVEICSECHPFYTGKEKLIDTAGRVEKFKTRRKKAETVKDAKSKKATSKSSKTTSSKTKKESAPKKKAIASKTTAKKSAKGGKATTGKK